MKVKFTLSIGMGVRQEDVFEYPDDTTEDALEADWQNWSANYIDGGYKILEGE